ncbi:MAG: tetratricopeptide repeat protein [Nitrospirae bacterium]|nr:tetratricopeptide repeat protein [Nitrospirota bacterium]
MKSFKVIILSSTIMFLLVMTASSAEILTNQTVVSMVKAGLGEELVISKIKNSQNQFDVSITGILKLKEEGVSEDIITAMIDSAGNSGKAGASKQKAAVQSPESEELYKKAIILIEGSDYDAAYDILKNLITENPDNNKYQLSYADTVLDQCVGMKMANNSLWKLKAKEGGSKIKALSRKMSANPDYYLAYAKYLWIAETRKESNIYKTIDKALYYKPDYPYAYIVKGDIYSGLARDFNPVEQQMDSAALTGSPVSTKNSLADTALASYTKALASPDLNDRKKAYVYYKMGELEYQILNNSTRARANWEKAVSLSPDSKTGELAKKRLTQ